MQDMFDTDKNTIRAENICFSAFFSDFENDSASGDILDNIISKTVHTHAYVELFISFDSGIVLRTRQTDIYLNPGELLMIPPGTKHVMLPCKSAGVSVGFSYSKLKCKSNHDFFKSINKLCNCDKPIIIASGLSDDMKKAAALTDECLKSLHILETLLYASKQTGEMTSTVNIKNTERDIGRISAIENLFITSFMLDFHAKDAADMFHISKRQLDRIIHKRFGMPFREVMTEYRMQVACKMLAESELYAESIGYAVGYNSKSAFYAAFKKKYRVTPIQLRNIMKSNNTDRKCTNE